MKQPNQKASKFTSSESFRSSEKDCTNAYHEMKSLLAASDTASRDMLIEVIKNILQGRYFEVIVRLDKDHRIDSYSLKEKAINFDISGRFSDYMKGGDRVCLHIEGKGGITSGYREHKFRRHATEGS